MEKAKLYRVSEKAAGLSNPRQPMKGRNRVY